MHLRICTQYLTFQRQGRRCPPRRRQIQAYSALCTCRASIPFNVHGGAITSNWCKRLLTSSLQAGGHNAGHTLVVDGVKVQYGSHICISMANGTQYDLHILPSGIVHPTAINLVGSGTVVSVPQFFKELDTLREKGINSDGRIFVSDRAHLLFELRMVIWYEELIRRRLIVKQTDALMAWKKPPLAAQRLEQLEMVCITA